MVMYNQISYSNFILITVLIVTLCFKDKLYKSWGFKNQYVKLKEVSIFMVFKRSAEKHKFNAKDKKCNWAEKIIKKSSAFSHFVYLADFGRFLITFFVWLKVLDYSYFVLNLCFPQTLLLNTINLTFLPIFYFRWTNGFKHPI